MLLRSALGMAIIMALMGVAQNVWQFLILRALLGLLGGFIPNANALIATQIPRHKSGWALGTLSTGGVSGALLGPLAGGLWPIATACVRSSLSPPACCSCALSSPCSVSGKTSRPCQKRDAHAREVLTSLKNPRLVLSLFVTTMIIQVATGSIAPILTLYVRDLAGNVSNIAFISGLIASVPAWRRCLAPRLGKLGTASVRKNPDLRAGDLRPAADPMSMVHSPWQLGLLRFLLGAADGALLPAVQTLLVYNSTNQIAGRIFSYNQSFRDIGNVTGPLLGAASPPASVFAPSLS
jgi:DHA1 family multidrug resistance protein-like MFS transporter